ncbi:MAG: S-methyl-5-thioribose-1-phosphate isomerase [Actinomycetota bacterium]|nr:S-methyl-5-thioribose-1-phosphate isomerase [Actinomycetota bacterium]
MIKAIEWVDEKVRILDQTKLPLKEDYLEFTNPHQVAEAIKSMKVRGAPALGVAAAFGIALGAKNSTAKTSDQFIDEIERVCEEMSQTRPTAANLFWAIQRMKRLVHKSKNLCVEDLKKVLYEEAMEIAREDEEANRQLGALGAALIEDGDNILTHCNTGTLATGGYGTALGVIRAAWNQGKKIHVYVDETRPLLQGSRLTCWELMKEKIPATLITDNMAGFLMSIGEISKVIVGADRIAANGDVANKIGTYTLAVLAKENNVPFYIAAPTPTIDFNIPSGKQIPIEERNPREVTHIFGQQIAPSGISIANPAFDITPHELIEAIITEKGIVRLPFEINLEKLVRE